MAAYEAAYRGVLLADASGQYRFGMAPTASLGVPALELQIGAETLTIPLPDPVYFSTDFGDGPSPRASARWRTLAVSVRAGQASVFLDGVKAGELRLSPLRVSDEWCLGRSCRAEGAQDQFFGFIDDVGLFNRALSEPELRTLARLPRLNPRLENLVCALPFDDLDEAPRGVVPALALQGAAELRNVSRDRNALEDTQRLPKSALKTRLSLPFAPHQVWLVIQGVNSELTHHDTAAFALDFIRVDPAFISHNPTRVPGGSHRASLGQPVVAAAAGEVVARVDEFRDDEPSLDPAKRNLLCVRHAAGEVSCVLHLRAKSARVALGASVKAGDLLAEVGATGAASVHLHFALSDLPEPNAPGTFADLVTLPFEFSDYYVSRDFGRSYQHVDRGLPSAGEWVVAGRAP